MVAPAGAIAECLLTASIPTPKTYASPDSSHPTPAGTTPAPESPQASPAAAASRLCASTNRATVRLTGQNGKTEATNPVVANSCAGKGAKKKHGAHQ
jgi:hypothetical protein